jgi:hypothetical protein
MNKNIFTYAAKSSLVEQDYYAPVAVLPITGTPISTIYCFLSRVDPWSDDANPEQPTQDQKYIKSVFKNMFVIKQVVSNNIAPVIKRNDWTSNTVYNYYRDDVDMFELDVDGNLVQNFYIRNSYDQVFKCLWNNNGGQSTQMPFFQPGTYGANNIFKGSDGYKWKYLYTIDARSKKTFMDSQWIPVIIGNNIVGPLFDANGNQIGAYAGSIDIVNVIDGGSGYNAITSPITVTITGDGTGAAAYAEVVNGAIADIVVTNPGSNYTYANVSITSATGSGAMAIAPTSPVGGHGFDPESELGTTHVMLTCEFDGSESGNISTNVEYRQVGLLINPMSATSYPAPATDAIYNSTTQLLVAPGLGNFISDETVYQGSSLETASFKATVLDFDEATNIISLINIVGTPTINQSVFGSLSSTVRTSLSVSSPNILLPSGYLTYIENRSGVQRSSDGIEQFKFVLGY